MICGEVKTFRTPSNNLPTGFEEEVAFGGLSEPTAVRFSPDGRVFVTEKSGLIKVFDHLDDTTAEVFADLRTKVHAFWDRGLLGLASDPNFPAKPYVYVAYAHDAVIGGTAPRWGQPGVSSDPCPTPPGPTAEGCVISGRVSRLTADGNSMVGPEQVLVEDWCQQYPSHSAGSLVFGSDGSLCTPLAVTGRASQLSTTASSAPRRIRAATHRGIPVTRCHRRQPRGRAAQSGSADVRRPRGPERHGHKDRPRYRRGPARQSRRGKHRPNTRRIVAHGFRNPLRITTRPGTDEVWISDVGWTNVEEIDRLPNPKDATADNFGWPRYEGQPHADRLRRD